MIEYQKVDTDNHWDEFWTMSHNASDHILQLLSGSRFFIFQQDSDQWSDFTVLLCIFTSSLLAFCNVILLQKTLNVW